MYTISTGGQIKNVHTNEILKGRVEAGYRRVHITNDIGKKHQGTIGRLVLFAFVGPPPDPAMTAEHINRTRDDNRLVNLKWGTSLEQLENQVRGPVKVGRQINQLDQNKNLIKVWNTIASAANALELKASKIGHACRKGHFYGNCYWTYYEEPMPPDEEWQPIPLREFQGFFASSYGRIKKPNGRIYRGSRDAHGYMTATVVYENKTYNVKVHKLVMSAFRGERQGRVINHLSRDRGSNELRNLEYITQKQNVDHALGSGPNKSKKSVIQFNLQGMPVAIHDRVTGAAKSVGIGQPRMSMIIKKQEVFANSMWRLAADFPQEQVDNLITHLSQKPVLKIIPEPVSTG